METERQIVNVEGEKKRRRRDGRSVSGRDGLVYVGDGRER